MDQTERRIIDDLFVRLGEAERRAAPRDPEAERQIAGHLERQPAAPYYMAQAIVVQQEALTNAQARIERLEGELRSGAAGGGFLGGLFGGGERRAGTDAAPPRSAHSGGPWGQPYRGGGGFLAGAAQTAMGVAGGVLIAEALSDLFAPDQAAAAEAGRPEDAAAGEDVAADKSFHVDDIGLDEF